MCRAASPEPPGLDQDRLGYLLDRGRSFLQLLFRLLHCDHHPNAARWGRTQNTHCSACRLFSPRQQVRVGQGPLPCRPQTSDTTCHWSSWLLPGQLVCLLHVTWQGAPPSDARKPVFYINYCFSSPRPQAKVPINGLSGCSCRNSVSHVEALQYFAARQTFSNLQKIEDK